MKLKLASLSFALAVAFSAHAADSTVKLSNVHLCCGSCVKGVDTALTDVAGVKAVTDKDAGTVTLTAADVATLQKGADALVKAGYFGKSDNKDVKVMAKTGAKGAKVQSLEVTGVHLCCPKCVHAVDDAVKSVGGVTGDDATKGAKTFTVKGDFTDKEVFTALQKIGLTGTAGK